MTAVTAPTNTRKRWQPIKRASAQSVAASQWYTPPALASQLWEWTAPVLRRDSGLLAYDVLEPAAGQGALLLPALGSGQVRHALAVESDPDNVAALERLVARAPTLRVLPGDFLELKPNRRHFHVALMNPPYEDGRDAAFIIRAFDWAPRVVGIFRSAILHGEDRYKQLWRWTDIERGAWLRGRPRFGKGAKSDSPRSDYVALQLVGRATERDEREVMTLRMEFW
jgi:predicted RNA methylase